MKNILSFGAGVQSTTLFLMACNGTLPKFDVAIFADTGYEPAAVYAHLETLRRLGAEHGIPVVTVSKGNLRADIIAKAQNTSVKRFAPIPYFTKSADGQLGITRRQCTSDYKIEPIERYVRREILGLRPRQPAPKTPTVRQFIGISLDEPDRIRESGQPWRINQYPLCNYPERWLPREFTRRDCLDWISKHFPKVRPPRSACLCCPYHSDAEWRAIRANPTEWADVVEFDRAIRQFSDMKGTTYLHRSCKPLDEVDFSTAAERGQPSLWGNECEGMCGV